MREAVSGSGNRRDDLLNNLLNIIDFCFIRFIDLLFPLEGCEGFEVEGVDGF